MFKGYGVLILVGVMFVLGGVTLALGRPIPQYGFVFGNQDTQYQIGLGNVAVGLAILVTAAVDALRRRGGPPTN
jgi:hypothetical protein